MFNSTTNMLSVILIFAGAIIATVSTILVIVGAYDTLHLSLPVPLIGHVLAFVLPGATFATLAFPSAIGKVWPRWLLISAAALTPLLSILEAALAVLAATLLQPELLRCELEARWQQLFHDKDMGAVRAIQDTLQCCGLWSKVDRAWPFPGDDHDARSCHASFSRDLRCGDMWSDRTRFVLGLWLAVGAYGLVLKALIAVLYTQRAGWMGQGQGHENAQSNGLSRSGARIRYLDDPESNAANGRRSLPAVEEIEEARDDEATVERA